MTCIVGVEHAGKVLIGGDSAGLAGWSLSVRADEKVFSNGPFVMGFTTSFRMGQLLRYKFAPPKHDRCLSVDAFMASVFVDAVRQTMKDGGYAKVESAREEGGTFLVGYRGRLYQVGNDFQIGRNLARFDAVGCGADVALGYLTAVRPKTAPRQAVLGALKAAERWSGGVRGPFNIVTSG